MRNKLIGDSLYLEDWAYGWNNEEIDNHFEELRKDFKSDSTSWNNGSSTKEIPKDIKILVAFYSLENYSGNAIVIFEYDGKLFEVNGSHCSCYGLEGQWEPEEITKEYISHRINNGEWVDNWACSASDKVNKAINEHLTKVLKLDE